jgi:hypothetical protein
MEELRSTDVPILAVAGDHDTICPPNTVEGTSWTWKAFWAIVRSKVYQLSEAAQWVCWLVVLLFSAARGCKIRNRMRPLLFWRGFTSSLILSLGVEEPARQEQPRVFVQDSSIIVPRSFDRKHSVELCDSLTGYRNDLCVSLKTGSVRSESLLALIQTSDFCSYGESRSKASA